LDYVLTPGRYVGLPDEEDDFDFEERVQKLSVELKGQMEESVKLDKRIKENLAKVGIEL
jgi:type I restriction enzyme M protein